MNKDPQIICMCGSTRFADLMAAIAWEYEKLGKIVLRVNYLPDWYVTWAGWTETSHGAEQAGLKKQLDELHCRKIDMCHKVFVCNAMRYIGESTRNEINYAIKIGKPVVYLEFDYSIPGQPADLDICGIATELLARWKMKSPNYKHIHERTY